jgi:hypothetical protein
MFGLPFGVPIGMLRLPDDVHTHFGMPVSKFSVPVDGCGEVDLPASMLSLHLFAYA